MEKSYELELEEREEVEEEESVPKKVLSWTLRNIKFLLIPGSRIEELTLREEEFEKIKGKRKFIRRFKSVLTVTGIVIVFTLITIAVFGHWLSPYTFEYTIHTQSGSWDRPSPAHPLGQTYLGYDVLSR